MATKVIGPIIPAAIAANVAATAVVGARVCAEGGVLQDESLPYVTYRVTANAAEYDLDKSVDGYFATFEVTVTGETYDATLNALNLCAVALESLAGTYATITVRNSLVDDQIDEPEGPIDEDGGQVFKGSLTVEVEYT